jgi:outer membrane protein assembly factor BamD
MIRLFYVFVFAAALTLSACSSVRVVEVEEASDEIAYAKAMDSYNLNRPMEAEAAFKVVLDDFPLSPYALLAQLSLADLLYEDTRYEEAAVYYTTFYSFHPSHQRASYALFQKGMSYFKLVLSADRDQTATRTALIAFEDLLVSFPEQTSYTEKAKDIVVFLRQRLAEREFYVGSYYFKNKNYKGALARFREILLLYSDTKIIDKSLYYIGESYLQLGEGTLAREAYSTLVSEFPESEYADDANYRLEDDRRL